MRGKSKYQEHMGKCLLDQSTDLKQPQKMKNCAGEWRKIKGLPEPKPKKSNNSGCDSILMVSMDSCPVCKETKEIFKEEIKEGSIEVMNILKDDGKKLAEDLGINDVPTFICKKNNGNSKTINGLKIAQQFKKEGFQLKEGYKKETLVENDVVKIDIDTEGIIDIQPKGDSVKLTQRDLGFISKVTGWIKKE